VNPKSPFLHERLRAYDHARTFYRLVVQICAQLPRGLAPIADQLDRAASSVSLAIAEGANARAAGIKRTHFDRAIASGGECAAALDQIADKGVATSAHLAAARHELELAVLLTIGLRK